MAELTLDLRSLPKGDAYAELEGHVAAVLAGITDPVAGESAVGESAVGVFCAGDSVLRLSWRRSGSKRSARVLPLRRTIEW